MKKRFSVLIDKQVILTMITCIVVAMIVLAFRYKSYEPCSAVKILVREGKIDTGELVRFMAEGKDISAKNLLWDYGDKSIEKGNGNVVTHIYKTPGKYDVTLIINGKCREYKTIYVTKKQIDLVAQTLIDSPTTNFIFRHKVIKRKTTRKVEETKAKIEEPKPISTNPKTEPLNQQMNTGKDNGL